MPENIQEQKKTNQKNQEVTSPKLNIRLLDRLEIVYNNQYIDVLSKSRKARKLVAFLILHGGHPVPVYKLYEVLWGEVDIDNPESSLKTLVSRTRTMLASGDAALRNCIIAKSGTYSWNMDITNEIDVFRVDALCKDILSATQLTPSFTASLDSLLCLYVGELLPEVSQEDWVIVQALRLEEQYKQAIMHSLNLLRAAEQWEGIVKTCRMSLVMLPFAEELHAELMRALIMLNRRNDAMTQYRHVTDLHFKHLGVHPPVKIQDIYKEIVQSDSMLEKDIGSISKELMETDDSSGAFVCEYAIFKDIYQLQLRSLERYKLATYLAIVKVSSIGGAVIEPMVLDEVMQKLLVVLKKTLRKGDTITRYTASQFVVLLQGPALEAVQKIMDRIKLNFYREPSNSVMVLEHLFMPLPAGEEGKATGK